MRGNIIFYIRFYSWWGCTEHYPSMVESQFRQHCGWGDHHSKILHPSDCYGWSYGRTRQEYIIHLNFKSSSYQLYGFGQIIWFSETWCPLNMEIKPISHTLNDIFLTQCSLHIFTWVTHLKKKKKYVMIMPFKIYHGFCNCSSFTGIKLIEEFFIATSIIDSVWEDTYFYTALRELHRSFALFGFFPWIIPYTFFFLTIGNMQNILIN